VDCDRRALGDAGRSASTHHLVKEYEFLQPGGPDDDRADATSVASAGHDVTGHPRAISGLSSLLQAVTGSP